MRVPLDDDGKKIEAEIAAETDGSPAALAYANEAAEAHSILLRVRRVKRHLVERYLCLEDSETSDPLSSGQLTNTLLELFALDRYELRAISRRDRAMRNALKAIKKT